MLALNTPQGGGFLGRNQEGSFLRRDTICSTSCVVSYDIHYREACDYMRCGNPHSPLWKVEVLQMTTALRRCKLSCWTKVQGRRPQAARTGHRHQRNKWLFTLSGNPWIHATWSQQFSTKCSDQDRFSSLALRKIKIIIKYFTAFNKFHYV